MSASLEYLREIPRSVLHTYCKRSSLRKGPGKTSRSVLQTLINNKRVSKKVNGSNTFKQTEKFKLKGYFDLSVTNGTLCHRFDS